MDYIGRALVSDALQEWREQLQSQATVSPLRDLVATSANVIDLRHSHPSGLAQLFAGRPTALTSLLRDEATRDTVLHRGRVILEEAERVKAATGAWTGAIAIGTLAWHESERDVEMPLLLRAVDLERHRERDVHLTLRDHTWINPIVVALLRERAAAAGDENPPELPPITPGRDFDPRPLWDAVRARTDLLGESLAVRDRLVLGAYEDPEQRLLDDLDDLDSVISASPIIAAAAGDRDAVATLSEPLPAFPKGDRDPFAERGAGDLDDTQFAALDLIATGRDVFLQSPPGADAVGTAAAIGADGAASGRTVAIVSGEEASLKAVSRRLGAIGAGDLVIDGTVPTWNTGARARLLEAITMGTPHVDDTAMRRAGEDLLRSRSALHRRFDALHRSHRPWGVSAFEAVQAIVRITTSTPAPGTTTRLGTDAAAVVAEHGFASVAAALARTLAPEGDDEAVQAEQAAHSGSVETDGMDPWWTGHADAEQAPRLDEALASFLGRSLPKMRAEAAIAAHETGVDEADSFATWVSQVDMFASLREILEIFSPAVFHRSLHDLVAATAPHGSSRFVEMPRRDRRALMRRAVELLRPGRSKDSLHDDLVRAHDLAQQWRAHCSAGGWPVVPDDYDVFVDRVARARGEWDTIATTVAAATGVDDLPEQPWDDMVDRLDRLALGVPGSLESSEVADVDIDVDQGGFAALVEDLRERGAGPEQIRRDLEFAWWAAAFDAIVGADATLTEYGALAAAMEEFRTKDAVFAGARIGPLMRAAAERRRSAIARHPDLARDLFAALVEGADASFKELWRDFAPLVTALRPVILAKAEQVSRLAPASRSIDLAVVVGGESLALAELVPTLARAKQVVVVGDAQAATRSAVAALAAMLPRVTMHAAPQPRDPRVSALLAASAYGRALPTQPAARGQGRLTVRHIDAVGTPVAGTSTVESTKAEVDAVVEHVARATHSVPRTDVVVVAGNDLHAARVRDALAQHDAKLASVAVETLGEVAGHHAHEVVLTLGYAADSSGEAPTHLGALSSDWGRQALVQALVCASHDITVLTTLSEDALASIGTADAEGVEDLRELIRASRAEPVAPERPEPAPSDWLLADVAQRLRRDGYAVHVRYGTGADAIPMVVGGRHDRDYTVAVVTDEATPAGSVSLRDRIRRQRSGLERLGWRVVPLWTLDVFMDPDSAAAQVLAALPENDTAGEEVQESLDLGLPEGEPSLPLPDLTEPEPAPARPEPDALTIGLSTLAVADAVAASAPQAPSAGEPGDADLAAADATEEEPVSEPEQPEQPEQEKPEAEAETEHTAEPEPSEGAPQIKPATASARPAPRGADRPLIPTKAWEDSDEAWGGRGSSSRDEEILREKPPHW